MWRWFLPSWPDSSLQSGWQHDAFNVSISCSFMHIVNINSLMYRSRWTYPWFLTAKVPDQCSCPKSQVNDWTVESNVFHLLNRSRLAGTHGRSTLLKPNHLPGIEQNISMDVVVHHLVQYVLLDQIENMIRDPYFKWKYMHDWQRTRFNWFVLYLRKYFIG